MLNSIPWEYVGIVYLILNNLFFKFGQAKLTQSYFNINEQIASGQVDNSASNQSNQNGRLIRPSNFEDLSSDMGAFILAYSCFLHNAVAFEMIGANQIGIIIFKTLKIDSNLESIRTFFPIQTQPIQSLLCEHLSLVLALYLTFCLIRKHLLLRELFVIVLIFVLIKSGIFEELIKILSSFMETSSQQKQPEIREPVEKIKKMETIKTNSFSEVKVPKAPTTTNPSSVLEKAVNDAKIEPGINWAEVGSVVLNIIAEILQILL